MTVENLSTRDKKHLWHPLTQHKLNKRQLAIVRAKDALLFDEDGKEYIDGIASWYTVMYGHSNKYIVSAMTKQMNKLDFVMFSGLTHEPAIELSENKCAAFVFEPLVQGAAGMRFHSTKGLDELIDICQKNNVLSIADEIMTGFGKTGKNFASDYLENKPDIICLSKALTAGMFPLSITSCSQVVFNRFLSDEVHKGFFHAHTFSAHPIGCVAALAGIELLNSPEIIERRKYIESAHISFATRIENHEKVGNVRVKGVILAIDLSKQMERYGNLRDDLYEFFVARGVLLRPLGNTIYVLPPYVITNSQLQKIYKTIIAALETF